ncbi:uncharacterized protein LOC111694468 [Trichogramma pretiosum]|uniref:uncharacterized protein LOC111694468 n=1 Tax=Trichogramma pretiosum TaxID=7493 RepID=UPI000C7191CD|nr:uncharacterized protein LOC111694468 [Trichogramma pretiosum]
MSSSSFYQWKCKTETLFNSCSVNFKPKIEIPMESSASIDPYQYLQEVRFFDEQPESDSDEDICSNGYCFDLSQLEIIREIWRRDYENPEKSNDVTGFFDWKKSVITYSWNPMKRKILSKREMNKQINDLKFGTVNLIRLPLGKKQIDSEQYKVENLFKNPAKMIPSVVLHKI